MKRITLFFALLLTGFIAAFAQKTFKGTIAYTYEVKGENAEVMGPMLPERMIIKYADEGMMTRMEGGMIGTMMGKVVLNVRQKEAFILQDSQKVVYLMDGEDLEDAKQPTVKAVEKQRETDMILGYTCQKYKVILQEEERETTQYLWITEFLKAPELEIPDMPQLNTGMLTHADIPGFPMRTEVAVPNMQTTIIMTASHIDFDLVPAETFQRPADYVVKDFSELLQGMGLGE